MERSNERGSERSGNTGSAGGKGSPKVNLSKHLSGINYPVKKNELITRVRSNGAPDDIVQRMQRLNQDQFNSMQDVTSAFEEL